MTRTSTRSSSRQADEHQLHLESLHRIAREVPRALEKVTAETVGLWPETAAALMGVFDEECAFAREGSAGDLGSVDRIREGTEKGGNAASNKRQQISFVSATSHFFSFFRLFRG